MDEDNRQEENRVIQEGYATSDDSGSTQDGADVVEERKPRAKRKKMLSIKHIRAEKGVSLVEWRDDDTTHRGCIPTDEYVDGECDKEVLDAAAPYGEPWASFVEIVATPEAVEEALHKRGIWTMQDLYKKAALAKQAFAEVIGPDFRAFLTRANKEATK